MNADWAAALASIALIFLNAFFVAAEYSLVSVRKSQVERLAQKGNRTAGKLCDALQNLARYVAGLQISITICSIGVGSLTEPAVTRWLQELFRTTLPVGARVAIALLIVTFMLVVLGELVPKYVTLHSPERMALFVIRPLRATVWLLGPLVWLVQRSGAMVLKPFGIDVTRHESGAIPKEELLLIIESGGEEGGWEKTSADLVTRALKMDNLDAADIMIHRLDMKWVDADSDAKQALAKVQEVPFTRLPVCRGDLDELVGVVYVHDIVTHIGDPAFRVSQVMRDPVLVPENLQLDKVLDLMRENKTQILIVVDEYGGTSGMLTLEDVVEEVFGEVEDRLESERPTIELLSPSRVSARAEVRMDELVDKLGIKYDEPGTETLAQTIVDSLGRVPRPGDTVSTKLGTLRVENMARRRVSRVTIQLSPEWLADSEG